MHTAQNLVALLFQKSENERRKIFVDDVWTIQSPACCFLRLLRLANN